MLYADVPSRRARQVAADLAVLAWVALAAWAGRAVNDLVDATAAQVARSDRAGRDLAANLGEAGDFLGRTPFVGEEVRSPFDAAASASREVASTGAGAAETIATLGTWLGVLVVLVAVLLVAPYYLPRRIGWVLAASAARRLVRAGDLDLLAARALAEQPLRRISRRVPGAAAGWRRGEPPVVEALAGLQLESLGVQPSGGGSRRPPTGARQR